MQVKARDILYHRWEDIPFKRLRVVLQLLPVIDWDIHDEGMNTYCKNILLKYLFVDFKLYRKTTPAQRVDLFTHELEWLHNPSPKFLLPEISIKGFNFYAPMDGLTDLRIEELAEADTRLSRYLISNDTRYLHTFLACLYTEGQGDSFTEETIQHKGDILSGIEDYQKISIIRSYMGSRLMIMKLCPDLFPTGGDKPKIGMKPQDLGPMWDNLIFDLANTKGYPGVRQAKEAQAIEALQYLNREVVQARESQQKHRKNA
jgi:hypothetical protein